MGLFVKIFKIFRPPETILSGNDRISSVNKAFTLHVRFIRPILPVGNATGYIRIMLIFWDHRLVFLATPKAGSTAVEVALESLSSASLQRPAALKHTNIATYGRHVGPWLQAQSGVRFDTVALMREPVDWLRSWYRFKQRDDLEDPDHAMEGASFPRFARRYAASAGPDDLKIGTQSGFLVDPVHQVDRIFRYEDMDRFVTFLEDRLDCGIRLPRINVPPAADVGLPPDEETALRHAMHDDLRLYEGLDQKAVCRPAEGAAQDG